MLELIYKNEMSGLNPIVPIKQTDLKKAFHKVKANMKAKFNLDLNSFTNEQLILLNKFQTRFLDIAIEEIKLIEELEANIVLSISAGKRSYFTLATEVNGEFESVFDLVIPQDMTLDKDVLAVVISYVASIFE